MNTTINTAMFPGEVTKRPHMSALRKSSLVAGILYLLTFVSIPTLVLYSSIHLPGYIAGRGPQTAVITGGILEIIVALAGIGTAAALYPVLKRQNQGAALGLVACRVLEAGTMFAGVAFLITAVNLRKESEGANALVTSHVLVTLYDRIFLLGQSFLPALNDLLLGFLLYQSRLVPRVLSLIGMIGAIPLVAGWIAVQFGFIGQYSVMAGLAAIMVALFEFSLGIYLVVKGVRPCPVTADM
jgi:hypothetical protein